MFFLYFFLLFNNLSSQNIEEYKKLIEQALSQNASSGQNIDIRIQREKGSVKVIDIEEKKAFLRNNYQYPLEIGDVIENGYDADSYIYINNFGIIYLTRNTKIEVSETQDEIVFSLIYGTILIKTEKLKRVILKIKTLSSICNIKGTQVVIEHNKFSNQTGFAVIDEGEVEIYPNLEENESNKYKLVKNQEVIVIPSSKRFKVSSLSNFSRYRSKFNIINKKMSLHKTKWRLFTTQERFKFRNRLFEEN